MTGVYRPFVSVVVPCLNEEKYIENCLRGIASQTYPGDRLEILVADGGSADGTPGILARLAAGIPNLRLMENPDRIQSSGLNRMIRESRGDVIGRIDAHCDYAPDYIEACVDVLAATGADNVGGAARPRARTAFQRALCAALSSRLGVGGSAYRSADREGYVDTVPFGAFRRSTLERVGLFNPRAATNEDAELNQRILDAGGRIYLSRRIVVHYYPRESFAALSRQYFRYGQGRARTLSRLGRFPTLRPALPFLMVISGALLLATSSVQPLTPAVFGAYAAATAFEAVRTARPIGWTAVPLVWAIFPVLHVSHGLGFAAGLLHFGVRPDTGPTERLAPRL